MLCRKYGAQGTYMPMLHSRIFTETEKYRNEEFTTCKVNVKIRTCYHMLKSKDQSASQLLAKHGLGSASSSHPSQIILTPMDPLNNNGSYIPDMVQEGANATSSHQGNSIACKTSLKANPYLKL
ncbi:hypothetical protein glysoja_042994 [Glycine soja]|uniref:Uncharacterized protein n=1 Tax=Glycine soja TaxID=3848 RepID=A0A0B2RJT8_GLYSO|nr:hypothetical protein glysoja_042994 [Glycine soja]